MSTKVCIINSSLQLSLRNSDFDGSGNYEKLCVVIKERGVHGDAALEACLTKTDVKKMLEFLRKAAQVLS